MTQGSVVDEQNIEREYREHLAMARAMLARDFPSLRDHEEIYQEAWAEALEMRARGEELTNLGGLLRTIVWRRARDKVRNLSAQPVDPESGIFGFQVDPEMPPDEQVQLRIDGALARQVVDSLDERQASAIRMRFFEQLDSNEIQRRLGVTRKRLDKIFTSTYREVEHALTDLDESSEWRRRQRSLLFACETGVASARQRRVAQRMVAEDPRCRAMLQEIRGTLKGIAALVPLPVVLSSQTSGAVARTRFAFTDRWLAVRDQVAEWTGRAVRHGSSAEQAGVGGAATAVGGTAVKAALVCVAVSGTAVVCVTNGVLGGAQDHSRPHKAARPHRTHRQAAVRPPDRIAPPAKPTPRPAKRVVTHHTVAVKRVAAPPPPSPAPTGSTEFGPGSIGSSSAPATPAAAPSGTSGEFTP